MGCLAGSRQAQSTAQCRIASMMLTFPTLMAALVLPASAQIFRLPDANACEKRVIHAERFGKRYHFSWLEAGPNTKWDWEGARNYCRKFCMDSIAINSVAESKWVSGLRSSTTSGPEVASVTLRAVTGKTCSRLLSTDGTGPLLARGSLLPESAVIVSGPGQAV